MINILLACGIGASSGFIARSMRMAAKQKGIECKIQAVGDLEIPNYIQDIDVLMIGPHISYKLPEFKKLVKGTNKIVGVMSEKDYSMLNGAGILEDILDEFEKNKKI